MRRRGAQVGKIQAKPLIWKEINTTHRRCWETKMSLTVKSMNSYEHWAMCCAELYNRISKNFGEQSRMKYKCHSST